MAKVDLSSQAWCDLVFSGKNKAYGAYKMRETSPRRHNIAVILVIVIALIGFSIPTLIKMATPKQKEVMTEVTTLSQLEEPEVKQEEMKAALSLAPVNHLYLCRASSASSTLSQRLNQWISCDARAPQKSLGSSRARRQMASASS